MTASSNSPESEGAGVSAAPHIARLAIERAGGSVDTPQVVDLCLNGRWRTVTASITDRSEMTYPVLFGRDVFEAYTLDIGQTVEE
ncbi:hypothetical protein [Natronomonas sp. EA1]|uniref:hypothetical protein n=1 Tax=Natronomonas sp. EA1 TaxID=3421655 RepID=UPI003EBA85F7